MNGPRTADLGRLTLELDCTSNPTGQDTLRALLDMGQSAIEGLERVGAPLATLGRIRGTGRGVSFGAVVDALECWRPLELESPFEGSGRVAGAVWSATDLIGPGDDRALAKLRWDRHAQDLPMHAHEHSDRFFIVLEGRGFFHVTDEPLNTFSGTNVRSVPARERDVFAFTRGVVHTFSTDRSPMTLLSCQLPYLQFSDPCQYTLPEVRWTAQTGQDSSPARIACDPAWSDLIAADRFPRASISSVSQ